MQIKKVLILFTALSLLLVGFGVLAVKQEKPKGFSLPASAEKISDTLYYLGKAKSNGIDVEGYAILRKEPAKGGVSAVKKPKPPAAVSCYGFLAKGAKWKTTEDYMVNTTNNSGLADLFVMANLAGDTGKWETAASNSAIFGAGTSTSNLLLADTLSPDNKNEVYFAGIDENGVIAVTIIWGVFGGPPQARQLVEWDMVFDDVDFAWSASDEEGKMDFENIATHELGHAAGLADVYENVCSEVTMFGYADYGETKKRTLEPPDITGISLLYQ